jgi:GGDEF domain-containing protein
VRAHDVCCRIEADEFAVILTDMTRLSCSSLLGRLRDKLSILSVRGPFAFALSMGTASFPEQGTTFDALVRVAEDARLEDKRRQSPHPDGG